MNEWKLFVWRSVLTDYTSGIAVAAARDVCEARQVLIDQAADYEKRELAGDISVEPEVFDLPAGAFCWGGG